MAWDLSVKERLLKMGNTTNVTRLEENLSQVLLVFVHAFFIDDLKDGLIVIDTGYPPAQGNANPVLVAIDALGRKPQDVTHILITHAHADHIGNVSDLQAASGATIWASAVDAPILEAKEVLRPYQTMDGRPPKPFPSIKAATVQKRTHDGEIIPLAGGIEVIATPGHGMGHQAFLWHRHAGILFVGDVVTNVGNRMELPPNYENLDAEKQSIRKLLDYSFDKIAFSHGTYISHDGSRVFRERWGKEAT